jgi:hypothetical protein
MALQAAKFQLVLGEKEAALKAMLSSAKKEGHLRILDIGSGPGTASVAFLMTLLSPRIEETALPPKIELIWVDSNKPIMQDGAKLVETLTSHFPKLRNKVEVKLEISDWRKWITRAPKQFSIAFFGNVLNEDRRQEADEAAQQITELLKTKPAGGVLIMEPSTRHAAQLTANIRDLICEQKQADIWGPCLHTGRCPLAMGRDWCHNSIPTEIPGHWFKVLSKMFGSERQWVKFCHVWLASPGQGPRKQDPTERRVVSDPLNGKGRGYNSSVLLCEPERCKRLEISKGSRLRRGESIRLAPLREPAVRKGRLKK